MKKLLLMLFCVLTASAAFAAETKFDFTNQTSLHDGNGNAIGSGDQYPEKIVEGGITVSINYNALLVPAG